MEFDRDADPHKVRLQQQSSIAKQWRYLPDMPLRIGHTQSTPDTLLLLRKSQVRAPNLPTAMADSVGDECVRTVQVPLHHAHQDQAVQRVAQSGDVRGGTAAAVLCGSISLCRSPVCDMVPVRAHRTGCRGGAPRTDWVALLDQAGRGDGGPDRRGRFHVHPV